MTQDPLRKSLAMWLYGFIGYPPRHIAIAPASVGVPQANSGKTLRKSTCKGFWLWLAERKLPYKEAISRWICPDPMRNQPISISKSKKAIADYKKAIGRPEGMAELSIFYCDEAFSFLESCGMEDESYFLALVRMYDRATNFVLSLPPAERGTYVGRLDKLRSRARHVGWGVQDEFNDLWYAAGLDEHHSQ